MNPIAYEEAPPAIKTLLDSIRKKRGKIANIYLMVAKSPNTLKTFLTLSDNLKRGEFTDKEREAIDLAVAEQNMCEYCLAAHTILAKLAGFSDEETMALRRTTINDNKLQSLTALAKEIVKTQGQPDQEFIDRFLQSGYSESSLIELIAVISKAIFTNYLNHIAGTEIDFPKTKKIN